MLRREESVNFIKSVLNGVDLKNWIENVCHVFKTASTLQTEAATVCIANQREEKKKAAARRWIENKDILKQRFEWTPAKWSWAHYNFWVSHNPYVKWADAPQELHSIAREVGGYPQIFKIEKTPVLVLYFGQHHQGKGAAKARSSVYIYI